MHIVRTLIEPTELGQLHKASPMKKSGAESKTTREYGENQVIKATLTSTWGCSSSYKWLYNRSHRSYIFLYPKFWGVLPWLHPLVNPPPAQGSLEGTMAPGPAKGYIISCSWRCERMILASDQIQLHMPSGAAQWCQGAPLRSSTIKSLASKSSTSVTHPAR